MGILAGILAALLLLQTVLFLKYQRQVKDICRQLAFLVRNDSNMMITSDIETGEIGKLKDSLNELISRQRREKNRYQEKEKMISEIYTSLSHDIRTPLTSLDGYFQLLETSEDPEEQSRYIQIIQERISSLKEMLEELFLFAKLKNDSYKIELSACCFSSILKQTVFSYYDEWQKRGLKPEIQIPEERLYFTGNEQALRRLIQNVIKNGLDHGKDKIGIRMYRKEGRIVLRISNRTDHPEQINISRVFERFYKADGARSRTSSGLGLSIARELAARMEGEMRACRKQDAFAADGKPVFLPVFHFPVPGRGLFLFLFKQPGKIKGIVISHRPGYITDRQIGFLQKRTGPPDPVIQQIFLRRAAGDILKEAVQVGPLNIQVIRNYLDINGVGIIVFNIAQRFLYVTDFLFLRRNIGSGKFAGQKIQIFI